MSLQVVFNQATGNIEVSSLSNPVLDTLLKITDPQGVAVHTNAGFAAKDYTSPDLTAASNSFTVAIPLSGGSVIEGAYTIEYHENDLVDDDAESMAATFQLQPVKLCIDFVVSCTCSKIDLTDSTAYPHTLVSRAWAVDFPTASSQAQVTGTNKTLQVGPNIWSGAYDVYLTAITQTTNETNVTTLTENKGYKAIEVSCKRATSVYSYLKSIHDKYESLVLADPMYAKDFKDTFQMASGLAQLWEMSEAQGNAAISQVLYDKLEALAEDCDCADCEECEDNSVTEIEPVCGSAGGGLDTETVQDIVAALLSAGSGITITYDDAGNSLEIASSASNSLNDLLDVDTTGVVAGDLFQWNGTHMVKDPFTTEANAVTTIDCHSALGHIYGFTNPCTASSYTLQNAALPGRGAFARIQNATAGGPTFTLAGGTVTKIGDWSSGYDVAAVNHVLFYVSAPNVVNVYLLGTEP